MRHLVSAIIGVPALGALLLAVFPARSGRVVRGLALAVASVVLALSLALWLQFEPRGVQWQFVEEGHWLSPLGIPYIVGADGFGALVLLLTTIVTWSGLLLSQVSAVRPRAHDAAILAIEAGVLGTIASLTFILFAFFWIVGMTAGWWLLKTSADSQSTAVVRRFGRYASVATIALLAAMGALVLGVHSVTGGYTFDIRTFQQLTLPMTTQVVVLGLFLVAFGIVIGAFPLHLAHRDVIADAALSTWIPVAVVLGNLGAFGMMRVGLPIVPDGARQDVLRFIASWVFFGGTCYSLWISASRSRLEQFVAYVSVAQVTFLLHALLFPLPRQLTLAAVSLMGHNVLMLALALGVIYVEQGSTDRPVPPRWLAPSFGTLAIVAMANVLYPTPILSRIETSIARIVVRASPEHAAEVADCLTASQAPPPPSVIPGLPSASMAAPCDTTGPEKK
jgi:NAD(P)H-quinone oxidoreductase subunit 4